MQRIASFEKVSLSQFSSAMENTFGLPSIEAENLYANIIMPKRATAGSAGYDFHIPFNLELSAGKSVMIPTGIRARIEEGWVLQIFPRSSLGFKYKLSLDNTVGIIDADYYGAANEGHIIIKVTNHSDTMLVLKEGDRFAQGLFIPFGITINDDVHAVRIGGLGSTDVKKAPVTVTKRCNPTTGYNWEVVNSNEEVVKVTTEYKQDPSKTGMVGVCGTTTFTFEPLKQGESQVQLLYKRSWEKDSEITQVYRVIVDEGLNITLL